MQEHLVVNTSQKTENLLALLLQSIQSPISIFKKQTILVANSGMQRYLELEIAKQLGICSHVNITYMASFLWQCQQQTDGLANKESSPPTRSLAYLIYNYFVNYLATDNSNSVLNHALKGLGHEAQQFNFAQTIAELFMRYNDNRPQIFAAWRAGKAYSQHPHEPWQRQLFQTLALGEHLQFDNKAFIRHCQHHVATDSEKIHVFGFAHINPTQLAELYAIANHTPVHFYTLNPSKQYWFDILNEKQKIKLATAENNLLTNKEADNPLLASWGKAGKYLLSELTQLETIDFDDLLEKQGVTKAQPKHYLAAIQQAILDLDFTPQQPQTDWHADSSFVINCMASPRREIEVLHDHLLDLLNYSDICAADVIVMVPNLADYSEHIHSVFAGANQSPDNYQHIPYTLANQTSGEENPDCKLLLHLLDLINDDFTATAFFEFCHLTRVRERFALDDSSLKTIRRWLVDSRTSWGLSTDFRTVFDLDSVLTTQGHFEKLNDRLFYEYAIGELPHAISSLFQGQKDSLALLSEIITQLKPFTVLKFSSQNLLEWKKTLLRLCQNFLPQRNSLSEAEQLIDLWFSEASSLLDSNKDLPFSVIYQDIKTLLIHHELRGPFLGGGVSFCVMQPMRAIPAKVVCILGMNEDYPSYQPRLEFDLQSVAPKLSDKNNSDDCKYIFLESLLSAKSQFYVSYIGIDKQTGEAIPPSILLQTLENYLKQVNPQFYKNIKQQTEANSKIHGFSASLFPDRTYSTLYQPPTSHPKEVDNNQQEKAISIANFFSAETLANHITYPLNCYLFAHYQIRQPNIDTPIYSHDFIGMGDGLTNWQLKNSTLQSQDYNLNLDDLLLSQNLLAPATLATVSKTKTTEALADYLNQRNSIQLTGNEAQGLIEIDQYSIFHPSLYFTKEGDGIHHHLFFEKKCNSSRIMLAIILHLIATDKLGQQHATPVTTHCLFFDTHFIIQAVEDSEKYWQLLFDYLALIYQIPMPFQLQWKLLKSKTEIICDDKFLDKPSDYHTQNQSQQLYFKLAKRLLSEKQTDIDLATLPAVQALLNNLANLLVKS